MKPLKYRYLDLFFALMADVPNTPILKKNRVQDDDLAFIGRDDFVSSKLKTVQIGGCVSVLGILNKDFKLGRRRGPSSHDDI